MAASSTDGRSVWSWCFYDFANSPFTTLVVTFIYATYFTQAMASDVITGTALWSRGVTITALVVALVSPLTGALADRGGFRKLFLLASTVVAIVGSVGLYVVAPGQPLRALVFFVAANIAFEMGMVFYNAFLPDVAPPEKIGQVSGNGWGLGYAGGLLALVVAWVGLVRPEVPWFGFSKELGENIRATNLLVAIWFALFSLPLFLFVREDKSRITRGGSVVGATVRQLVDTFHEIRQYRQVIRFLLARLVYNDGLVTVFAFGGIFAAGTFGFTFEEIFLFGIVLNITAGIGAVVMGHVDDRIGGKRTIMISLVGLAIATILAVTAPFLFPPGPAKTAFWVAGILIGIFSGPNQAASRSLMGRFVPPDKENEFFGFFAFSGKATAFMGPFLLGTLTAAFDSQPAGVAVVVVFFVVGMLLLAWVDEEEGKAAATGFK